MSFQKLLHRQKCHYFFHNVSFCPPLPQSGSNLAMCGETHWQAIQGLVLLLSAAADGVCGWWCMRLMVHAADGGCGWWRTRLMAHAADGGRGWWRTRLMAHAAYGGCWWRWLLVAWAGWCRPTLLLEAMAAWAGWWRRRMVVSPSAASGGGCGCCPSFRPDALCYP